ncbi:MAG: FTR1 family iron permease [Elusimicrobiota bacterium]|jgi:high-affinity iron transporter|nr:FTR1 family iron permease [Elusimicrobiota bacterium]
MRKAFITIVAVLVFMFVPVANLFSAYDNWNQVVNDMEKAINESYTQYQKGDIAAAKKSVDYAYFGFYEKFGLEKTVMAYISGNRAAQVEYQFSIIKKAMTAKQSNEQIKSELDKLTSFLREDANRLDGKDESAIGTFFSSLIIIAREGFEAIIIVGAIIAYLRRSGNQSKTRSVYIGALIALGASVIMAYILNSLSSLSGANQELVEGITMLIAVAVLFYVSNWMVSKSESAAWSGYIEKKVESSISKGSLYSLAFAAFLAVFREGAETILFYQALLANTNQYLNMFWLGFAVGCVLLVFIFILIRFLSVKIPLRPFFLGTSVLLFAMSISFIGAGIKELQEGNLIGVTPISFIQSIDILGIYPTLETLIPQIILLIVTIITFALGLKKAKKQIK